MPAQIALATSAASAVAPCAASISATGTTPALGVTHDCRWISSISVSRIVAAQRADPFGERMRLAQTLQRFALGNAAAGERRHHGIGEMQPQPLLLACRQCRCFGAGYEGCKFADDTHGTIALLDVDWLSILASHGILIAETRRCQHMPAALNETHDPARRSFVESANAPGCDFPIQNLPFGVFRPGAGKPPRVGVAIGDRILDVAAVASLFDGLPPTRRGPARRRGSII